MSYEKTGGKIGRLLWVLQEVSSELREHVEKEPNHDGYLVDKLTTIIEALTFQLNSMNE